MHKQQKFILIAAVVGIAATFMPWISVSAGAFGYSVSESRNGFHGIGILYFLTMIAAMLLTYAGNQFSISARNIRFAVIGSGALCLICLLIFYTNANDQTSGGFGLVNASIGIGLILSLVAAAALVAIPLVITQPGESLQGDLSAIKNSIQSAKLTMPNLPAANRKQDRMLELEKLIAWRNEGKITQQEFEDLKAKII